MTNVSVRAYSLVLLRYADDCGRGGMPDTAASAQEGGVEGGGGAAVSGFTPGPCQHHFLCPQGRSTVA